MKICEKRERERRRPVWWGCVRVPPPPDSGGARSLATLPPSPSLNQPSPPPLPPSQPPDLQGDGVVGGEGEATQ